MTDTAPDLIDLVDDALQARQRRETHAKLAALMAPPRPKAPPEPTEEPPPPAFQEDVLCGNCGMESVFFSGSCAMCAHLPHRQHWTGRPPAERRTDFVKLLGLRLCQVQQTPDPAPVDYETAALPGTGLDFQDPPRFQRAPLVDAVSDEAMRELGALTFAEYRELHPDAEPNDRPFAHLPNWDTLRIAAYRRWPDERFWRSPSRFEEARQLAGGC